MINQINDVFYVSNRQIYLDDFTEIVQKGIKTIICNRPDGEVEDQPNFLQIKTESSKYGIEAVQIAISSGQFTSGVVDTFTDCSINSTTPILAYCRTGTRSTILWSLSQKALGKDIGKIISTARMAGYDVAEFLR